MHTPELDLHETSELSHAVEHCSQSADVNAKTEVDTCGSSNERLLVLRSASSNERLLVLRSAETNSSLQTLDSCAVSSNSEALSSVSPAIISVPQLTVKDCDIQPRFSPKLTDRTVLQDQKIPHSDLKQCQLVQTCKSTDGVVQDIQHDESAIDKNEMETWPKVVPVVYVDSTGNPTRCELLHPVSSTSSFCEAISVEEISG